MEGSSEGDDMEPAASPRGRKRTTGRIILLWAALHVAMEASREGAALPPCRHGGTQRRFVSPWAVAERNSALYGGGNGCCAVRKRPSYGGGAGRKTLGRRNRVYYGGLAARREREHRRTKEEFSFGAYGSVSVVVGASRARNACGGL